jgi:hypothetical protein
VSIASARWLRLDELAGLGQNLHRDQRRVVSVPPVLAAAPTREATDVEAQLDLSLSVAVALASCLENSVADLRIAQEPVLPRRRSSGVSPVTASAATPPEPRNDFTVASTRRSARAATRSTS